VLNRQRTRPVRGAEAVRRLHPWDEPATLAAKGGERIPTFKLGAKGFVGKQACLKAAKEVSAFRKAYRTALAEWRKGDRDVAFPHATYEMRRLHLASVLPETADHFLTAEGPTLDEVKAELEAEREAERNRRAEPRDRGALRNHIVSETKFALHDEAETIVEHEDLDMVSHLPKDGASNGAPAPRHRFDKKGPTPRQASRSVTRRDKRGGRRADRRKTSHTPPTTATPRPPPKDRDPPR